MLKSTMPVFLRTCFLGESDMVVSTDRIQISRPEVFGHICRRLVLSGAAHANLRRDGRAHSGRTLH